MNLIYAVLLVVIGYLAIGYVFGLIRCKMIPYHIFVPRGFYPHEGGIPSPWPLNKVDLLNGDIIRARYSTMLLWFPGLILWIWVMCMMIIQWICFLLSSEWRSFVERQVKKAGYPEK